MAGVESRSFDSPDETRTPSKTKVELVRMGPTTAARHVANIRGKLGVHSRAKLAAYAQRHGLA